MTSFMARSSSMKASAGGQEEQPWLVNSSTIAGRGPTACAARAPKARSHSAGAERQHVAGGSVASEVHAAYMTKP